jgi:hypothetical protein
MSETTSIAAGSYSDEQITRWDPFDGERDVDIRCQSVRVVTTRTVRQCVGHGGRDTAHQMAPGTRARLERALVEGVWGSYYICVACMETWLGERGISPEASP